MKPTCFSLLDVDSDFGTVTDTTDNTNHSHYSSPVEALNLIVDPKSQPVELDNSTISVLDFLALMRFDMTFDVTLRDDSSFGKPPKYVSFSLLLVIFSLKANFEKEHLWKSIYLRFPGSLKPISSITFFSQVEKNIVGLVSQNPFKLN